MTSFEALDRNRDGFLTPDEVKDNTDLEGAFAGIDTDGDGRISPAEFQAWLKMRSQ
jgi:Ca2+-binding EF-hand superfamily protein